MDVINSKYEIRICGYEEIKPLCVLSKESVDMSNNGKTVYIGCFLNGQIIGVVGYQWIGKKIRYKTDGVLKPYRGNGVYSSLFKYRESICKKLNPKSFTAFCTNKSLGMYINNGFVKKDSNSKITFVERNNYE